jgi:hypothetical protein
MLPGERIHWLAPFGLWGRCDGTLAITSLRTLAVYRKRTFRFLPPGATVELRRHQAALRQITYYKPVAVRRSEWLLGAALIFLWYPLGTIVATVLLGLYFAVPRQELGIWSGGQVKRRYPLAPGDRSEAIQTLDRLLGRGGGAKRPKAAQGKKAG